MKINKKNKKASNLRNYSKNKNCSDLDVRNIGSEWKENKLICVRVEKKIKKSLACANW